MKRYFCSVILLVGVALCLPMVGQAQWVRLGTPSVDWITHLVASGSNLIAVAYDSGLFRSSDNGASWTDITPSGSSSKRFMSVAANGTTLIAGTWHDGVFTSTDDGTNWTASSDGITNRSVVTVAICGSQLYAGTYGGIFRSVDGGSTWRPVNSGLSTNSPHPGLLYTKVLTPIGTDVFSVIVSDELLRLADGDTSWTFLYHDFPADVLCLARLGTDIFVGTAGEGVYCSTDSGISWTRRSKGITVYNKGFVRSLAVSGSTLVAAMDQGLYLSANYGTNWISASSGMRDEYSTSCLYMTSDYLYAGAFDGGIWRRPLSEFECCIGTVGNVDLLGIVDLVDLSVLVSYLTSGGYIPQCSAAANVNRSGIVDLGDLSVLVSYLTGAGFLLPSCQ